MRRILTSLLVVGVAATVVVGATQAFFNDTETSTGNVFAAGAIDLLVDNTSYVTDANGDLVRSPNTSWELDNLEGHLFFNFLDLKPGDIGEDTISLHVKDNNAWLCAAAQVTDDNDNTYTEPELEVDPTQNVDPTLADGELDENLNFAFWADDGDNVLEKDEVDSIFVKGPVSGLNGLGQVALADSSHNIWNKDGGPVDGDTTVYIGKAWCFGTLTPAPVEQDNDTVNGPLDGNPARGTGFTCSGAGDINNAAQTDIVKGDLQFYAVQSRNNPEFTCAENYKPVFPTSTPEASPTASPEGFQTP